MLKNFPLSKSTRKGLINEYTENIIHSLSTPLGSSLKELHHQNSNYQTKIIEPFVEPIRFEAPFRSFVGSFHEGIVKCFNELVAFHNDNLVGIKMPEQIFELSRMPEVSDAQDKAIFCLTEIGKSLAYKKRHKSAIDSYLNFMLDVACHIENLRYSVGVRCYTDIFIAPLHAFINAFSFELLKPFHTNLRQPELSSTGVVNGFNVLKLCKNEQQSKAFLKIIERYGVEGRFVSDDFIETLAFALHRLDVDSVLTYEDMLYDVNELLPLYMRAWDKNYFKVDLGGNIVIHFESEFGVPGFVVVVNGSNNNDMNLSAMRFSWGANGRFTFLCDQASQSESLAYIGYRALSILHDKLLVLYSKRKPVKPTEEFVDTAENFSSQFLDALSYSSFADPTVDIEHSGVRESEPSFNNKLHKQLHLPSMTMSSFFSFMAQKFNCQYDNGKGSEMKIWRPGGKIYIIGKHKREQKMPSERIKRILKRLEIPVADWLNALRK